MMGVLRVVKFGASDCICQIGEPVDFFGFVAYGELRVGKTKKLTVE